MKSRAEIGAVLRAARERKGLSLEQVARKLGMRKQGVAAIETGVSGPAVERLADFAEALGLELSVAIRQPGTTEILRDLVLDIDDARLLGRLAAAIPFIRDPTAREYLARVAEREAAESRTRAVAG